MNTERIERALREGPPDEPMYVPGGHRQAVNRNLLAAVAGVALAAALVIGVVVGVTLDTLRGPSGGVGAPNVEALAAELEGMWTSEATTPDAWVEGLLALGYAREDVELALGNFPPYERARWQLVFADEHLQIFGSFDGGPWIGLSGGPYELLPDGSI
jgi:hypothetical protein